MTLMSTDDRYADDVHYSGGCVSASTCCTGRPPCWPGTRGRPTRGSSGDGWRENWLERLEGAAIDRALAGAPAARRLLEARLGLRGLLRDRRARSTRSAAGTTATRTPCRGCSKGLAVPRKGLIGPWAHAFPETGSPARASASSRSACAGGTTGSRASTRGSWTSRCCAPGCRTPAPPQAFYEERPGRWVAEPEWPSPSIGTETLELGGGPRCRPRRADLGVEAGVWCAEGGSADLAGDQRVEDAVSLRGTSSRSPSRSRSSAPAGVLELEADRPLALVGVRLCDVAPDGSSLLVTRGVLNLTHRESHEHPSRSSPGGATRSRCRST